MVLLIDRIRIHLKKELHPGEQIDQFFKIFEKLLTFK